MEYYGVKGVVVTRSSSNIMVADQTKLRDSILTGDDVDYEEYVCV